MTPAFICTRTPRFALKSRLHEIRELVRRAKQSAQRQVKRIIVPQFPP